ncbi:MAG TPA: protein translocase subunit SecD, partial [Thermodesulfobacteriota bacterium]|nr:protein translocase subunit SecD [Thermodesulfobacteriota bacterium]
MKRASRGWIIVILVVTFLSLIFLTPTVFGDRLPGWWGKVFPRTGLTLGLDLRGGVFLLLGVRADKAVDQELANIKESLTQQLNGDKVVTKGFKREDRTLTVSFFSESGLNKALNLTSNYENVADIERSNLSLKFTLKDDYIDEVQRRAIDQVKETITNRVDEFGVVEPTIQRTGADRILVQVPGASAADRERIVNIIKRAAVLEFKIVKDTGTNQETLLAKYGAESPEKLISQGSEIHRGDTGQENEKFFITESEAEVTGQYLSDARLTFDEFGRPAVSFTFSGEGASKFGKLTEESIGKRLAIVLDGTIKSAPVIRDRISSQGIITGDFTTTEARDLALVLRSGALPVPVEVEQERTVGPSLGRDSIERGKLSMIVGGAVVVL